VLLPAVIESALHWLETAELIRMIRTSLVLYTFTNGFHILSIAVMVGSLITVDLRITGIWRADLWFEGIVNILPITKVAFVFVVLSGLVLFSINGVRYLGNDVFIVKMIIIFCGLANILIFHKYLFKKSEIPTLGMRISAGFSILFWIAAVFAGRAIAYL